MTSLQSSVSQAALTDTPVTVVISASNPLAPSSKPHTSLAFTSRGTAGEWYKDGINYQTEQDPGPSSATYGQSDPIQILTSFAMASRFVFVLTLFALQARNYGRLVEPHGY
jgi:hypothetical protein